MPTHDIVVVGASAGGVEALTSLVRALPGDLPASLFVVLHLPPGAPSLLPRILDHAGPLSVVEATDQAPIERGRVYVAPPDCHLLLEPDRIRVVRGPPENRHRPAIDPLFRSAAWAFGPRVIGVVLSGKMDDGAGGLWAVKTCGGISVVQEPEEASYPEMPSMAMQLIDVDHRLRVAQIAELLVDLARRPVASKASFSRLKRLRTETEFAMGEKSIEEMGEFGQPSAFTCPECQGSLWELRDGELVRYRCHVGHAFSPDSLLDGQTEVLETALYSALRALEEKSAFLRRMSDRFQDHIPDLSQRYETGARELDGSAEELRKLLALRAR